MNPDWLAAILKTLFFVAVLALTTRWLERSRHRSRLPEAANELAPPPAVLAIGTAGTLVMCGGPVLAVLQPDPQLPVFAFIVLASFVLLPGAMIAAYFFGRRRVSDEGMDFGRMLGGRVSFRWTEVRGVSYGRMGSWFLVELQSGRVLRVSSGLMGLESFAGQVLRHVPAARIEKHTLSLLEQTSRGVLPRLGRG